MDIQAYEHRIHSQNGEDGILAELIRRCGSPTRICVEIGVGDGSGCNTRLLREQGWAGLAVGTASWAKNVWVGPENVVELLQQASTPEEFDVLSLDIDGNDYWVLQALLGEYSPRILVVEYNALLGPDAMSTMPYDPDHVWDVTDFFGASLQAYTALAASFGYGLIGCESRGVNAFFLRNDLLARCLYVPAGYPPFPSSGRPFLELRWPRPGGPNALRPRRHGGSASHRLETDRDVLEAQAQAGAFCLPQHDGSVLCRALDRYDMYVDPTDRSVAHWIATLGYWKTWITIAIGKLLAEGQTVVNVGANVGYFALLAAGHVGPRGKVWAFEPQPALAALLGRSADLNGMDHLEVLASAVGDGTQQEATLSIPEGMLGGASVLQGNRSQSLLLPEHEAMVTARRLIRVPCVALDHLADRIGAVDLLIVAAEGYEPQIWSGMRRLLEASPRVVVIMEFSPSWYADPAGFLDGIVADGFGLWLIDFVGDFVPATVQEACASPLGMLMLRRRS